jgi:hypothetical protein
MRGKERENRKMSGDYVDKCNEEYGRHKRLLKMIFELCDLAGFKVESRIVLRDKRNGRVWR